MNSRFLPTYQALLQGDLRQVAGLWLIHGDEPLLTQWLIDGFRPIFAQNDMPIKRLSLHSPKDWHDVLAELDSLSLFGGDNAVILSGKATPTADVLEHLTQFAEAVKNNETAHTLIYELPKQDKKAQTTKLFKLFATHGNVIDCQLYDEKMRSEILAVKATRFGIRLNPEAWQLLLADTENNLLAGYQALWRLSDLYPSDVIDLERLKNALVSDYQYSVFNLCDTLLLGDTVKTLHILHELKRLDTAPSLVLWGLGKEIRTLLQLQSGKPMSELGIWQSKAHLYHTASQRLAVAPEHLAKLYEMDKLIKGVLQGNVWQAFETLIIHITAPTKFNKN